MAPSLDGTFELTAAWQLPGGQLDAYTLPIITGIMNEVNKVKSMTGALALTVSLASTLAEKLEL
jgi:hypothetical protein